MRLINERINMNSHLRQEKTLSEVSLYFSCLSLSLRSSFYSSKLVQVVQLLFVTKLK
jgi:hypothetical protein